MGLINTLTLFIAGFNLGQLNYEKISKMHPISCPFFVAQVGTIAYTFSLQVKSTGDTGYIKYIFSVIGNIGDFLCVTAYMLCYINRVFTFIKNASRWEWVKYIPFYYIVIAITETLVDLNIVYRQPGFIYIYSIGAIIVALFNLATHTIFSIIIYKDLKEYPKVRYVCIFTLLSCLVNIALDCLTFIGYLNFEPVYLCSVIDMLIFLYSNRIILKTVESATFIPIVATSVSDSIQVTPRASIV